MKVVKDDRGRGQVVTNRADVGLGHVHRNRLHAGLGALQTPPERHQGVGPVALPDKHHCPAVEVQHHGEILLPLADGDLVNGDLAQFAQLGAGESTFKEALLNVAACGGVVYYDSTLSQILRLGDMSNGT